MNTSASRFHHLIARALLALVFLCVQQTATLHWLSHSIEATKVGTPAHGVEGIPAAHHCDDCLAFHALGAAAVGATLVVAVVSAPPATASTSDADASPAAARLAFRSRAPPTLS